MNDKKPNTHRPAAGLTMSDVYFVVFRHKWKIIICSAIGLVSAVVIFLTKPVTYQSEAYLLIKYIKDSSPSASSIGESVRQVDPNGDGVINTEVVLLGSYNVAMAVATNMGPSTILGKAGGDDPVAAANLVRDNLTIDRYPASPVIRVIFSHPDRQMVRPILKSVIDAYQAYHVQIHQSGGESFDSLVEMTGNLHTELLKIEEDLRKKMADADVIDLDATKKQYGEKINLIDSQIMTVNNDLALHTALLKRLQGDAKDASPAATNETNASAANAVIPATADAATNVLAPVPQETIDDYNQTGDEIDAYKKQLLELRTQAYSAHSKLVLETQQQIKDATAHRKQLEKDEPRLAKLSKPDAPVPGSDAVAAADPVANEQSQVDVLQIKLRVLQESLASVHSAVTNLEAKESDIRDSQLTYQLKEKQYTDYLTLLNAEKANIDIGALKDANIVTTQDPTPPALQLTKTPKMMAIAALAGILAGLAWAFFTEYYLDHTVRRAKEVESDLNLRLFLSIPDVNRNGYRRLAAGTQLAAPRSEPLPGEAQNGAVAHSNGVTGANGKLTVAPWDKNHSLSTYYEALRDRLISYFEVNNLNHKPKLVAVTGASQGCGASTIAAGLAASLSETGDGNVLLINMNIDQGAAQQFHKGKPNRELHEALANDTRDVAMVQKNLYVVSGSNNGDELARMLPKRFANLLPSLKASDYDYIIFDMPPIARTGVTQRLAGFMDMMLLVVEAEKTSREVVRQAGNLLTESKANVSVVLNKTRTYIPKSLHQEF